METILKIEGNNRLLRESSAPRYSFGLLHIYEKLEKAKNTAERISNKKREERRKKRAAMPTIPFQMDLVTRRK